MMHDILEITSIWEIVVRMQCGKIMELRPYVESLCGLDAGHVDNYVHEWNRLVDALQNNSGITSVWETAVRM